MRTQKGLPATPSQASPLAKLPASARRWPAGQSETARASGLRGGRGQTLLEILLAFSVSILVLSAVIVGITTSLSNAQYTKNQSLANSYAKEGMAVVRKIKESDWTQFYSKTQPVYCLEQNSVEVIAGPIPPAVNCPQNVGIFSREIVFDHDSDDCIADTACSGPACLRGSKVTVTVAWSDGKCSVGNPLCHNVELITCFSNIDLKATPAP